MDVAASKYSSHNYYQLCAGMLDDIRVIGYACIGKEGIRNKSWRPQANWARSVLHACGLQTEWSELPVVSRSTVGRLAGVARMPFCGPGNVAASTALANLPQSY